MKLTTVLFIAFIVFGWAQLVVGFLGNRDSIGSIRALPAPVAAFIFRCSLPLTIGAFLGAMIACRWHWKAAALLALPALLFVIRDALAPAFALEKAKN